MDMDVTALTSHDSGLALINALVERVLVKYAVGELAVINGAAFSQCRCFDVPFMRGVLASGARVFHQPNLFWTRALEHAEDA